MKTFNFILLSCFAIAFTACNSNNTSDSVANESEEVYGEYTANDSAAIYNHSNVFVDKLLKGELKEIASNLCVLKNNKITKFSAEEQAKFVDAFEKQPIYAARVKSLGQQKNGFFKVDILAQIDKKGSLEEGRGVSTISLTFVKTGAEWFMILPIK